MRVIRQLLVVGAGVMGHGIALVCAQKGLIVELVDVDSAILNRAQSNIERFLQSSVDRQKISAEEAEAALGRLSTTTDLEAAAVRADLIVEAVVEDMVVKGDLLQRLNELCEPAVIFASNTSQLSITELGRRSGRPERLVGMHWFNPPPLMQLIEIPRGLETSDETVATVVQLSKRLGKTPMVCQDSPGFVVGRLLNVWYNEGMRMLDEGVASAAEIDRAIRDGGGFRMGPLELRDLVGLDVALAVTESLYKRIGHEKFRPPDCLRRRVEAGHLGRKTGRGFHTYGND